MTPFMLGSYPPGWDPSSPAPGGPCLPNAAGVWIGFPLADPIERKDLGYALCRLHWLLRNDTPGSNFHGRIVTPKEDIADPNLATAWACDGWMKICLGEHNIAIEHVARAMRLSPLDPRRWEWQFFTALAHLFEGRYNVLAEILWRFFLQKKSRYPKPNSVSARHGAPTAPVAPRRPRQRRDCPSRGRGARAENAAQRHDSACRTCLIAGSDRATADATSAEEEYSAAALAFPELPANRTYGGHRGIDENDPNRSFSVPAGSQKRPSTSPGAASNAPSLADRWCRHRP